MGPDMVLIRRINIWENMNLVGRRVAYRPKNIDKIKCLGLVWEWFGGVGEAIGNKKCVYIDEINLYKI